MKLKQKYSLMTAVYIVIFAAVLVLANVIVTLVTERMNLQIDMTPDNRYALTDETYRLLSKVDVPVTVTMLTTEPALRGGYEKATDRAMRNGEVTVVVYEHLTRMARANSNITLAFTDPDLNPEKVSQYKNDYPYIARGSVIIVNENTGRFKVVYWADLVSLSPEDQEYYDMIYYMYGVDLVPTLDSYLVKSEGALSSALQFVLNERNALAAFITGHDAPAGDDDDPAVRKAMMTRILQRANFEVSDIDLRREDIPPETDLLILMAPFSDFTDDELSKLDRHFGSARRPHAAVFFNIAYGKVLPNYNEWMAEWGIQIENQILLDTQSPSSPSLFDPLYAGHDIFGAMSAGVPEDSVLVDRASPLTVLWNTSEGKGERGRRMLEELMATRNTFNANDLSGGSNNAANQRFIVGTLCWQNNIEHIDGESSLTSLTKIAVLPGMLADPYGLTYAANDRMLINVINYLVPQNVTVDAPVKKLIDPPLLIGNKTPLYVVLIAIPLALLAMGFTVYFLRRNK
jgi:hypothetical protein